MQTIIVKERQTIFDVAVQYCGSIYAVSDIVELNRISFTDSLVVGQKLVLPDVLELKVVKEFLIEGVSPATDEDVTGWAVNALPDYSVGGGDQGIIIVVPDAPYLSVDRNTLTEGNGRETTFRVYVQSNINWVAEKSVSWVMLVGGSGGFDGSFVIAVGENDGAERTTTIVVRNADSTIVRNIAVTQKAKYATPPVLNLSETFRYVSNAGEVFFMIVYCDVAWTSTHTDNVTMNVTSGVGNSTVMVTVAPNTGADRDLSITFFVGGASAVLSMIQKNTAGNILETSWGLDANIPYEESVFTHTVTCNGTWNAVANVGWITIVKTNTTGNGSFQVTFLQNNTGFSRVGKVTISTYGISIVRNVNQASEFESTDFFFVPSIPFTAPAKLNQIDYTSIGEFDMPLHSDGSAKFGTLLVGPNFRSQPTATNVLKRGFSMIDHGVMVVGVEKQVPTYYPSFDYDPDFVSSLAPKQRTINITLNPDLKLSGYVSSAAEIQSVDYSAYNAVTGDLTLNISKFFDGTKSYTDVGVVFLDIEVNGLGDLPMADYINRIIALYHAIKAGVGDETLVCLHYQSIPYPHVGLGVVEANYADAPNALWEIPASMTENATAKGFPSELVGLKLKNLDYLLGLVELYPFFESFQVEEYTMLNVLNEPLRDWGGNDISFLSHFDMSKPSYFHIASHLNAILEINLQEIGNHKILLQSSIFNQAGGGYYYGDFGGTQPNSSKIKQCHDGYIYKVPTRIVEYMELNTLFLGCWFYAWMDTNAITPADRSLGEAQTSTDIRRDFVGMTALAAGMKRLSSYKGVIDGVEYSVADLVDGTEIYTGMNTQVDYINAYGYEGIRAVKGTDIRKHRLPVVRCIVNEGLGLIAILYYRPYDVELPPHANVYFNDIFQYKVSFVAGENKILVGKLRV